MKELYRRYFLALTHPYRIHDYYQHNIPLPGRESEIEKNDGLTLAETILLSWPWAIVGQLLQIALVFIFSNWIIAPIQDQQVALDWINQFFPYSQYIGSTLQVLFFPFSALAMTCVSLFILGLWSVIPVEDDSRWGTLLDIFAISNTTSFFLLVPIFGQVLYALAFPFFLYIGLRKRWGLGRAWSIFLVLTPILTFILFSIMFSSFLTLFFAF